MRKKIVAANWKMNMNREEGKMLVQEIMKGLPKLSADKIVVIAPPFLWLSETVNGLQDKENIFAGAQNCSNEKQGAFTGETSAAMLQSAGVQFVILGHSERRQYFNEDSAMLSKKINQALEQNLKVIFCCGEPLEIREAERENAYVQKQIEEVIFSLDAGALKNVSIAYEPIWAIGTGRTATSAQAQEMHAHIRSVVQTKFGTEAANELTIIYGGSCNAANAKELFSQPDVDGGLIGGASLKAETFLPIVEAMVEA